jgi:hypothetical protein
MKERNKMHKLYEAKNLDVYKKLLRMLGEYSKEVASSTIGRLFDLAVEKGIKILPSNKLALMIVDKCLDEENIADSLQKLSNLRFSNLSVECRPLVKGGERHGVALWKRGDLISDKVQDLINWEAEGPAGSWSDKEGKKVTLLDLSKEEK